MYPINPFMNGNLDETPDILNDGNTVGWWDVKKINSLIIDGSGHISAWKDRSGNNHDLLQPSEIRRPTIIDDSISFDGSNDYMYTGSFTFVQPEFIYMVIKKTSVQSPGMTPPIFDGNTFGSMLFYNHKSVALPNQSLNMAMYAGNQQGDGGFMDMSVGEYHLVKCLYNGSSSFLEIDGLRKNASPIGNANSNGFYLGGSAALDGWGTSPIDVKEVILRKKYDDYSDELIISNYLKLKYNL